MIQRTENIWQYKKGFMKYIFKMLICCGVGLFALTGCSNPSVCHDISNGVMYAHYTSGKMEIDGMLNEPVWVNAQAYPMYLCCDRVTKQRKLEKGGCVKLSWDDENLYVAVLFKDSDIVAKGKEDNLAHFTLGDVCELFLKPSWQSWYWEMYATPLSKKTCYFLKKHRDKPQIVTDIDLQVAAVNYGSVNYSGDVDEAFCAEMAVPLKQLWRGKKEKFSKAQWNILIGRYNYSEYLIHENPEYSSSPELSKTDYHLLGEYARLRMVK